MSNDLTLWRFSFCYSLAFLILTLTATTEPATSTSNTDVLIIRHGRSRVRHSTEKDHIQWGLKAFDNFTLDYSDFDGSNDTTELYALNGTSSIDGNLSEYASTVPTSVITPSIPSALSTTPNERKFSKFIHRTVIDGNDDDTATTVVALTATTTTTMPVTMAAEATVTRQPTKGNLSNDKRLSSAIPNSKKKFGKRKIMENIKKNVDKGLEYLKAHFDLDESTQIDIVNHQMNGAVANTRQTAVADKLTYNKKHNDNENSFNENSKGDKQNNNNNERQLNGKRQNRKTTKKVENSKSFKINLPFSQMTNQQQQQKQQMVDMKSERQRQQPFYHSQSEATNIQQHNTDDGMVDDQNLFVDYQSDFVFDVNNENGWTPIKTSNHNNDEMNAEADNDDGNNHNNNIKKGPKINDGGSDTRKNSKLVATPLTVKKHELNVAKQRPTDNDKVWLSSDSNGNNFGGASITHNRNHENNHIHGPDDKDAVASITNGTGGNVKNDKISDDGDEKTRLQLSLLSRAVDVASDGGHGGNKHERQPTGNHGNNSHHKPHKIELMLNPSSSFSSDEVEPFASDYGSSNSRISTSDNNKNGNYIYTNIDDSSNNNKREREKVQEMTARNGNDESNENNNEQQLLSSDDDYVNNVPSVNTIDLNYMDDDNGESEGGNSDSTSPESGVATNNIYQMTDEDLSSFDETTRNNRRNLMRGRDLVTKFLQIVESQHLMGANCSAGTELNLGEGVVDTYAQDRFRVEAEVAVNRANMLTRIFKLTSPQVQLSEELLHSSVLSMIEFDDDIFAAGNCFDWNQHPAKPGLYCPFAYRLPAPDQGVILVKDLAAEYYYLGNKSEFFYVPRKNAEKVVLRNEQYIRSYHIFNNSTQREGDEILSVKYEDGRWSKPYFDCGGGNIWMLTYTVPFFGYDNGTYFFKGTSGIDIDLRRVDIDQCPQRNLPVGTRQPLNIFAGTDKCKQRTTECSPSPGLGFRRGSYRCICRRGYYFPDTSIEQKYFNGSTLEEEYEKLMLGEDSFYNHEDAYECLPCAEGCDTCEDMSPCVAELNWPMRTSVLILACAVIGFLPPAAWFTHKYQQVKVVRAASPALLRVIALGAFFIYCTSIVMYPNPSLYTCTARVWLREIGFSLTYGALMLKTWRISVIFRVRSAKAVKITDASLLKRLGILCGFVGVALLVRTLVAPPVVIVGRTADNLKAFLCKTDWWDHTFTSMEVLFLAWGVRLCIMVRKAPSEFNESRFISMAIYNEFLLTCFLNVSMLFLQSPANPDLLYIIFFCHTQLTVTLLLALIFGSKVYLVFRGGGKPHEEPMKSSGAKFISRSQPRTFANASSITTSTAQMGAHVGNDSRLTEQEALEEIKQICDQLKRLYDRIPSSGSAQGTIQMLLDSCRMAMASPNGKQQLMLKPPVAVSSRPCSDTHVDKSTNTTSFTETNGGGDGTTINHLCAKIMITDESDKQLQCNNNLITSSSSRCNNVNLVEVDMTKRCHKSSNGDAAHVTVTSNCNGSARPSATLDTKCCCCGCRCGCRGSEQKTGCDYNQIKCSSRKKNRNNNLSNNCGGDIQVSATTKTPTAGDSDDSSVENGRNGSSNLDLDALEFECMCSSSCDEDAYNDFKDNCDIALDPRELRTVLSELRKSHNANLNNSTNFNSNKYSSDFRIRGSGVSGRVGGPQNFESCDNIYYGNGSSYHQQLVYSHPMNRYSSTSNVETGVTISVGTDETRNKVNLRTSKSEDSTLLLGGGRPVKPKSPPADLPTLIIAKNLRDHVRLQGDVVVKKTKKPSTSHQSNTSSSSSTGTQPAGSKSDDHLEVTPIGKRKKSPEKRLVIDLNDRSKYTGEVSV